MQSVPILSDQLNLPYGTLPRRNRFTGKRERERKRAFRSYLEINVVATRTLNDTRCQNRVHATRFQTLDTRNRGLFEMIASLI